MVGFSDSSGSGNGAEATSNVKKLMAQSGSWYKVVFCDAPPEHLRLLSERESLSIDRDKGDMGKARRFADILAQDLPNVSKSTHVDFQSSPTLLIGPSQRHLRCLEQVQVG